MHLPVELAEVCSQLLPAWGPTCWLVRRYDKAEEAAEFIIDETFGVPGVGTVVAGMVKKGVISTTSSSLLLGPHVGDASFKPAAIKSIHYKRLPVTKVRSACLAGACMHFYTLQGLHQDACWSLHRHSSATCPLSAAVLPARPPQAPASSQVA